MGVTRAPCLRLATIRWGSQLCPDSRLTVRFRSRKNGMFGAFCCVHCRRCLSAPGGYRGHTAHYPGCASELVVPGDRTADSAAVPDTRARQQVHVVPALLARPTT